MKIAASGTFTPDVIYKEYRFVIRTVGKGWRAKIYAPGSPWALSESPATLEESSKEAIVAEAKGIVDARVSAQH